jgi:uncharacterized protein
MMTLIQSVQPLYSIVGFAVGMLIGMTGVGGGSLTTPLLILLFGIHPATAVGTDLLYAAATKTVGSVSHGLSRTIDWQIVRWLAAGSAPLTVLTLLALSRLDIKGWTARELIGGVLTAALFFSAATLLFRERITSAYVARVGSLDSRRTAAVTVAVGAVLGTLVSISSVGAGSIGVTALILLYPRLPTARLVGTDIAHAVPLTLAAGIGHWMLGSIDWHILGLLLVGSLPGILIGSYMAVRVPDTVLRRVLAGTLIVVAARLLVELHPFSASVTPSIAAHFSPCTLPRCSARINPISHFASPISLHDRGAHHLITGSVSY